MELHVDIRSKNQNPISVASFYFYQIHHALDIAAAIVGAQKHYCNAYISLWQVKKNH